jgi:hypothetical protein
MNARWSLPLIAVVALGCSDLNTPIYFKGPEDLDVSGMPGMNNTPSLDTRGLVLRFRNPTDAEQQALDSQSQALGFDVPWIARDKVHLELTYTVTNMDSDAGTFNVMIDGANEFTKYDMTLAAALFQAQNQPPVYLPLIQSRPQTLAAGASTTGTFREDDFAEADLALDAFGRWQANFFAVLTTRSDVNPDGFDVMPPGSMDPMNLVPLTSFDVVPAMYEIDVTMTADKHMTCTYMVRVRDDDDRLLHDSGDTLFEPQPMVYQPMLPPAN